jgi:glc operon protein GlcG
LEKKGLNLEAARKMVAAAEPEAERNDWRGVVAVVDDGGWIILLERMDHAAMTASVELAPGKARAAALFKKPSQALEETINGGRDAAITARGFIEMQGALPVVVDGEVIGAIGASFATPRKTNRLPRRDLPPSASERKRTPRNSRRPGSQAGVRFTADYEKKGHPNAVSYRLFGCRTSATIGCRTPRMFQASSMPTRR